MRHEITKALIRTFHHVLWTITLAVIFKLLDGKGPSELGVAFLLTCLLGFSARLLMRNVLVWLDGFNNEIQAVLKLIEAEQAKEKESRGNESL